MNQDSPLSHLAIPAIFCTLLGISLNRIMTGSSKTSEKQTKNDKLISTPSDNSSIVVIGSANADLYIDVKTIPQAGETIDGNMSFIGPGGKGSNQAGAAAKALCPTTGKVSFIGRVGEDQHKTMFFKEYERIGLDHSRVLTHPTAPTGQAYIILDEKKQNSIIIALGANEAWEVDSQNHALSDVDREVIKNARVLMLQREITDSVNLEAAKYAHSCNVPVMMDMGGKATEVDTDCFPYLHTFSLNETELARFVGSKIEFTPATEEENDIYYKDFDVKPWFSPVPLLNAAATVTKLGVQQVLVTLGVDGSFIIDKNSHIVAYHPSIAPSELVDTTGAGDCFRANYAVAFVEGKSPVDSLLFATAASTLCISKKGTLPSMPSRQEIEDLLSKQ